MWRAGILLAGSLVLAAGAQQAFAQKAAGPSDVKALGAAVAPKALDAQRGGQTVVVNSMDVDAKLHNNSAANTLSGSNVITESAFSHSSGLPVAIQNSGNNVIIQNAFILNLQMK